MTTQIISDINFTDPTNAIPFLERDDAIVRGVTRSLIDYSNPQSFSGAGSITAGQLATSLTSDLQTGASGSAFPAVAGGMVNFGGTDSKFWTLPDNFKLPNTCKRFLVIVWVKLPSSGYQTASGNTNQALIGYMNNTSTLAQWGFNLQTVQATGVVNQLNLLTPASGGTFAAQDTTLVNADTLALCDGNLHQLAGYFDGESIAGQRIRAIYVDGVAKTSAQAGWDNGFNVPSANVRLGTASGYQGVYPSNFFLGRPSMWDLTGTAWTPAQILARDLQSATGFLS